MISAKSINEDVRGKRGFCGEEFIFKDNRGSSADGPSVTDINVGYYRLPNDRPS